MLGRNEKAVADAFGIAVGRVVRHSRVRLVDGLIDAARIVDKGSSVYHEFHGTVDDRPATLRSIHRNGQRRIVILDIHRCVDGIIVAAHGLVFRQIPGRTVPSLATHEFTSVRVGVICASVGDRWTVVASYDLLSEAVVDRNRTHGVFDLDVISTGINPDDLFDPITFVNAMNLCNQIRFVSKRLGRIWSNNLEPLLRVRWPEDVRARVLCVIFGFGVFGGVK
mmetsp:Transcript_47567/g.88299  ORF Transcript_47567/g.88299 Transcript_47567/m.88299 type:complete len:223 (+) Transcript_47567:535-1203(+)